MIRCCTSASGWPLNILMGVLLVVFAATASPPAHAGQQSAFDAAMNRGFAALEGGDHDAALTAFNDALRIIPGHPVALAWLGNTQRLDGKLDAALQNLDHSVAAAGDYFPGRLFRAQAREQAGRVGDAIKDLREAVRIDPEEPTALATLARLLLQTGQLDEAAVQATALARIAPDVYAAQALLATIEQRRGHYEAALRSFKAANELHPGEAAVLYGEAAALAQLGRIDDAFGALATLVQTHPDYPHGWRLYAQLLAANRYDIDARITAADFYGRAHELVPGDLDIARELAALYLELRVPERLLRMVAATPGADSDAAILFLVGQAQAQLRNYDDAVATYDKAMALTPRPEFLVYQAAALRNLDRSEDAAVALRRATELEPEYVPAWVDLGDLLLERDQVEAAAQALRRAVQLEPERPQAHYLLGQALRRAGDSAAAVGELQQAAALDDTDANAFYNLGLAYRETGDAERSREALARFRELEHSGGRGAEAERTSRARGLVQTGMVQYRLGDPAAAIGTLQQAVELAPETEPGWFYLGLALAREKRPTDAVDALEKAVGLQPDHAASYEALATLYQELGRNEDAELASKRAAELSRQSER